MVELFIDNKLVDLIGDEDIAIEYAIAKIGELNRRVGARSIAFKLPKTANNKAIFEVPELVPSLSVKPYRRLPAKLFVNGIDMNMTAFVLESSDRFYNGNLYGNNTDLFTKIDKPLAELDLTKYNHFWTKENIVDSFTNTEGFIYSVIDYNSDSPNTFMPSTGDTLSPFTLQSCVFKKTVFEEIITQAGFNLSDSIDYRDKEEVDVLGCTQYVRDTNPNKYLGSFGIYPLQTTYRSYIVFPSTLMPTPYGDLLNFENTEKFEAFWGGQSLYGEFTFQDHVIIEISGSFRFRSQTPNTNFILQATHTTNTQTDPLVTALVSGNNDGTYQDYTFSAQFDLKPNQTFEVIRLGLYMITNGATFEFDPANSVFSIDRCKVSQPLDIKHDAALNANYVTISNNILDAEATQKEFISDYLKMHNAIIFTSMITNTCYVMQFDEVLKNIGKTIDWSGKLDITEIPNTTFRFDLGQENRLTYKEDDTVLKPFGTDGSFFIDDENLPSLFEFLELKYAASESVIRLGDRQMNQVKIYEDGQYKGGVEPRTLLLRRTADDINVGSENFVGDVPYSYFIDPLEPINMGFGNSLINDYFGAMINIINRTKIVECYLRLTANDIAQFDFLAPVYLKEFEAYFYVSKITGYEPNRNVSTKVELVKLY